MDHGGDGFEAAEHTIAYNAGCLPIAFHKIVAVYAGQLRGNCMSERLSSKNAYLASHVISDRELPRFIVPMVPTWVIQT